MYGTNIKLFDKPEYRTLLVNCLKSQSTTRDQLKITPSRLKQFDRGLLAGIAQAHYKHSTKGKISYEQFILQSLDQLFSLKPDTLLTNTKFTSYKKYFFNIIPGSIDKEKLRRINTFLKTISQKELYALGQQIDKVKLKHEKIVCDK